jgi:putative redox protein
MAEEANTVVAAENGRGKFGNDIQVGRHHLLADEPAEVGGQDAGPTPYQLLSAALGACTNMTLRSYAAQKNWPLERVTTRVRHDRIYAKDCAECETKDGRIDQLSREITLTGPLDDAQRARLMEMATRCPVHRTLEGEVRIVTVPGV